MGTLVAGVQYNDYKGSVAADRSDNNDLWGNLIGKGLLDQDKDLLIGAKLYTGDQGYTSVSAIVAERANASDPNGVREVETGMSVAEFLATFKRFEVVLVTKGTDTDIDYPAIEN